MVGGLFLLESPSTSHLLFPVSQTCWDPYNQLSSFSSLSRCFSPSPSTVSSLPLSHLNNKHFPLPVRHPLTWPKVLCFDISNSVLKLRLSTSRHYLETQLFLTFHLPILKSQTGK